MNRIFFNFLLALEGITSNYLRSFLTCLGIVFGVAAVIAMLAIGSGAKQSILEQMKLIGANNIVIESVLAEEEEGAIKSGTASGGQQSQKPWSPGLTIKDGQVIKAILPDVELVSPEIVLPVTIIRNALLTKARCVGVSNAFFEINNLKLSRGQFFHERHLKGGQAVCIIGKNIRNRFFNQQSAIGKKIKCGNTWLTVIGVLERRVASRESLDKLGIRDYNDDVYVPISTALLRFENRALVSKDDIKRGDWDDEGESKENNYHQLDRLTIRMKDNTKLQGAADVIGRILKRRHKDLLDYEVEVPELLLQQQQKSQDTWNLVLAAIAAISLLVGGIGIMNIMLASVLERVKEIGVRRSLGATQQDIIYQFLFEAIFISLLGGILGVLLGVITANIITTSAEIPAIVSTWSVLLSFGVAASTGLVFGLLPAQRAARQDPIKALRTD